MRKLLVAAARSVWQIAYLELITATIIATLPLVNRICMRAMLTKS